MAPTNVEGALPKVFACLPWHLPQSSTRGSGQHRTAQHDTAQCGTGQRSTAQHSMARHCMAQHGMKQHGVMQQSTEWHITQGSQAFFNNSVPHASPTKESRQVREKPAHQMIASWSHTARKLVAVHATCSAYVEWGGV